MNDKTPNEFYDTSTIYKIKQIPIPKFPFILIASARRTGKTVLVRELLTYLFDFNDYSFMYVFS